jgi:hypothetical protein
MDKKKPFTLEEFDRIMDKVTDSPSCVGIVYETEEELEATKEKLRELVKKNETS